jgi:anaerobic selenocysteine-containing dehydrogenase
MSQNDVNKGQVDRRGFLKALGAGTAGSAAALAVTVPTAALAGESAEEKKKKRYQVSDHVKTFYRTNRY